MLILTCQYTAILQDTAFDPAEHFIQKPRQSSACLIGLINLPITSVWGILIGLSCVSRPLKLFRLGFPQGEFSALGFRFFNTLSLLFLPPFPSYWFPSSSKSWRRALLIGFSGRPLCPPSYHVVFLTLIGQLY